MKRTYRVFLLLSAALLVQTAVPAQEENRPPAAANVAVTVPKQPAAVQQPFERQKDLPKTDSELRARLSDVNRRIDELDRVYQGWSNILGLLQQRLQGMTSTGGVDKAETDVENAIKSKGIQATKSALTRLYQQFVAPLSAGQVLLPNDNSLGLSPSGLFYARVDTDLNGIIQKYLDAARDWHAEGGGGLLYPAYGEAQPAFLLPTPKDIEDLKQIVSDARQKTMVGELSARLNSAIADATAGRDRAASDLNDQSGYRDQLNAASDKLRQDINGLAIQLGLPMFCGTVLLLFAIPLLAQRLNRGAEPSPGEPKDFQFGTLVEISTVLLLTMSILILGLADKLQGPVLGTLLGGISGYVLNRVREAKRPDALQTLPKGPGTP